MIKNKKGFSLIELVVTIAILIVLACFIIPSYLSAMENERKNSDLAALSKIDTALKHILIQNDVFQEIKENHLYDNNKVEIVFFAVTENKSTKVSVANAKIKGADAITLPTASPTLCSRLTEQIGDDIILTSNNFKNGKYVVTIEFNGTQVSSVRNYSVANDDFSITNSGDTYFSRGKNTTP